MHWGFVDTFDRTTGRGTIAPCSQAFPLPFQLKPGAEIAIGQRVTYDLGNRAINIRLDNDRTLGDEFAPHSISVDSQGRKV